MSAKEESVLHGPHTNNRKAESPSAPRPFELHKHLASLLASLPLGVVVFDSDLRILQTNEQASGTLDVSERLDETLTSGSDSQDAAHFDWTTQLKAIISSGRSRIFNAFPYSHKDQKKLLHITGIPLSESTGAIVIDDISEKVYMQKRLSDAERLATIGRLASKVAHELNNPMDGILRYINLAIRIVEQENLKKPTEYLIQARQGLMRMVQIVSELLEFSRSVHASVEYASLEHMVEDALKTMAGRIESAGVEIVRDFTSGIPQIRGANLFQVFCNLTKNAVDAMPSGGTLTISMKLSDNQSNVEIGFRDTGNGIPEDNIEKVFEPFFTTKGKGVGLGLAICKEIVNRYQGAITAANALDGGSIFTVYLPVTVGQ